MKAKEMVDRILKADRRAAARLMSMVEDQAELANEIMKDIFACTGRSMLIGVTGSGGSGKSSLIEHLIGRFRQEDKRVGVVAVDPSSPFSGGALLGDRIRFQKYSLDEGVFIRSMGSRGYLGGLARASNDVVRIMEAMGSDVVIIETLGAGQDEVDIIHIAQTCLLVLTPGMGDDIQAIKAGIMEIADLVVLNKADLEGANSCIQSLESAIHYKLKKNTEAWVPRVVPTIACSLQTSECIGIESLYQNIMEHQAFLQKTNKIDTVHAKRIEQELGLIFKDEVEKTVFAGLKGTGKKREYIESIMNGSNNPYSVVDEVLSTFLRTEELE